MKALDESAVMRERESEEAVIREKHVRRGGGQGGNQKGKSFRRGRKKGQT